MSSRSSHRLVSSGVLFSLIALTSCGFSYRNVTVAISPHVISIPVGGTMTFTSTVTNAPNNPSWNLLGYAYANLGSPATATGSTYVYTAPAAPPIYSSPAAAMTANGSVTLQAQVLGTTGYDSETFVITAPSITTAITPATATVALNGTKQFNAYAVGTVNNAITLQVNGVTGGSTSTGTIVPMVTSAPGLYVYTAPATMPMGGSTVTITVISQADPSKTASATITLQ